VLIGDKEADITGVPISSNASAAIMGYGILNKTSYQRNRCRKVYSKEHTEHPMII
jgi:hypothetical protein